jgi:hypothetical protein
MTPNKTLLTCTVAAFSAIMALYSFLSDNPLSSRIGFAALSSIVPGVLLFFVRPKSKLRTVVGYAVIFVAVQLLIAVL